MARGSGIIGRTGMALLLGAGMAAPAGAATEAGRIAPASAGEGVRIVTPRASGFRAVPRAPRTARRADGAQAVAALIALADRAERGAGVTVSVRVEAVALPYYLPYCQRGLFGRAIERPCLVRPDATILDYD